MNPSTISRTRAARALRLAALSASCLTAMPALAQEAAADEATGNSAGIEEITVTARKRVEDVQSVPIAVSAINGEALENRFVPDVRAVAKYIPNVQLGQVQFSGSTLSASIRGLTFADIERSFEPAVATSIDGIFLASNTGALIDMFDVESIEVLRGPQGTLFGRNTIGGIINVKRTRPTGELGLKLSGTIGSYGRNDYKGVLNTPIVKDVLALKVGVFSVNSNAMTYNYFTKKKDPGLDRLGITGTLLFTPSEKFEALFTYEHIKDRSHYNQLVNQSLPGSLACDADAADPAKFHLCFNGPVPGDTSGKTLQQLYEASNYRASFTDVPFSVPMNADNLTLNMKYSGENFDIVSVTGLWKNDDALDIDNIGHAFAPDTALFHPVRFLHGKQFSQELRFDSNFGGLFDIVAGVYYFNSKYELDIQNVYLLGGVANPGLLVDTFSAGQKVKSYAAFAETYWKLSDSTRITVGGRYTKETKDFHVVKPGLYQCPTTAVLFNGLPMYEPCRNPHLSFNKFTPRVSIDQKLAEDVMVYASWSRGFRSGGWNGRPGSEPATIGPYDPETVDSYELGLRSKFLDNRALFNLTVFQTDYGNKQEDSITTNPLNPSSTITSVTNASKARFRGVEAEAQFKPTADLHFFASAGYLTGKYLSFPGLVADGPDADNLPDVVDLRPVKNLRYAPKWNFSLGGELEIPVGSGDNHFQLGANVKYLGDYTTEVNKDFQGEAVLGRRREIIPSHTSVDGSISYFGDMSGTKYKLSAFVNDAFHKGGRIVRSSQAGPFWFSDRVPMRTWGLELQLEF